MFYSAGSHLGYNRLTSDKTSWVFWINSNLLNPRTIFLEKEIKLHNNERKKVLLSDSREKKMGLKAKRNKKGMFAIFETINLSQIGFLVWFETIDTLIMLITFDLLFWKDFFAYLIHRFCPLHLIQFWLTSIIWQ